MLDWIRKTEGHNEGYIVYSLDDAKAKYEVRELNGGYLVLNWDNEKLWLKFAVMSFYSANGDGSHVYLSVEFYGEGPSGSLRECRHTYWGKDGYLFFPNGKLITSALAALSEFYDDL